MTHKILLASADCSYFYHAKDKRMTGRGPDRDERNARRGRISTGGSGSPGPKSPLVLLKPVDKHGSEVADRLVMTMAVEASISIRSLLGFASRAVSSY